MPKKGSPSGDRREFENEVDVLPGDGDEKEASRLGSLSDPDHIASVGEDDDISDLESELEAPGEAALEDVDEDG
jgi:hypothetical protein